MWALTPASVRGGKAELDAGSGKLAAGRPLRAPRHDRIHPSIQLSIGPFVASVGSAPFNIPGGSVGADKVGYAIFRLHRFFLTVNATDATWFFWDTGRLPLRVKMALRPSYAPRCQDIAAASYGKSNLDHSQLKLMRSKSSPCHLRS